MNYAIEEMKNVERLVGLVTLSISQDLVDVQCYTMYHSLFLIHVYTCIHCVS